VLSAISQIRKYRKLIIRIYTRILWNITLLIKVICI